MLSSSYNSIDSFIKYTILPSSMQSRRIRPIGANQVRSLSASKLAPSQKVSWLTWPLHFGLTHFDWGNLSYLLPHFSNPHSSRISCNMSSKRKWDQAAPEVDSETPSKATKTEETKTASEAAATAAAIAAKIAAQFADGGTGGGKDPYDGEFTHDIDINDLRNRYLLTKGSTQQQVRKIRFSECFLSGSPEFCFFLTCLWF